MACITARPQGLHKATMVPQGYQFQRRSQNVCAPTRALSSVSCVGAGLYGGCQGDRAATFCTKPNVCRSRQTDRRYNLQVIAGNKGENGIFAPIVRVTRNAIGTKEFNQLRGKAISLHSQVIKDFCKQLGVDTKQVQGLIRLAKKNGEWLGFLA